MKDHYLSQFYLKGFTDPAARRDLWVYPFSDPSWRTERPKDMAWEEDYYGDADDALRIVENTTARILRKVRRLGQISEDDRIAMCAFVTTMMGRIPALIETVGEETRSRSEELLRERYQRCREDPGEFDRLLKEMRDAGFSPGEDWTIDDINPDRILLKANSPGVALLTLRTAATLVPDLMAMRWTFLVSTGRDFFVTSDHPFYAIDRDAPVGGMYGFAALRDPGVKATLPLGRHVALYLWRGTPGVVEYREVDSEAVAELNFRTAWLAVRFIAGPSSVFPGSDDVQRMVAGREVEPRGAGQ